MKKILLTFILLASILGRPQTHTMVDVQSDQSITGNKTFTGNVSITSGTNPGLLTNYLGVQTLKDINTLAGWTVNTDLTGWVPVTISPGVPLAITIYPSGAAYKNDYIVKNLGSNPSPTNFTYCAKWAIPNSGDLTKWQGVEADFDVPDSDGWNYTGGLQFLSATGGGPLVRVFDMAGQAWHTVTGAVMPLTDTGYHSFCYSWTNDQVAKTTTYTNLTIDGISYTTGQVYGALNAGWSPVLNVAIQLDGDSVGDSYTVYVKDWSVTYNKTNQAADREAPTSIVFSANGTGGAGVIQSADGRAFFWQATRTFKTAYARCRCDAVGGSPTSFHITDNGTDMLGSPLVCSAAAGGAQTALFTTKTINANDYVGFTVNSADGVSKYCAVQVDLRPSQ